MHCRSVMNGKCKELLTPGSCTETKCVYVSKAHTHTHIRKHKHTKKQTHTRTDTHTHTKSKNKYVFVAQTRALARLSEVT